MEHEHASVATDITTFPLKRPIYNGKPSQYFATDPLDNNTYKAICPVKKTDITPGFSIYTSDLEDKIMNHCCRCRNNGGKGCTEKPQLLQKK